MNAARCLLLAAVLPSGLGCVTMPPAGQLPGSGCEACHGPPADAGPPAAEGTFVAQHAIPNEQVRRPPPPPEAVPPGRFSPVPVRPVFFPQPPVGW